MSIAIHPPHDHGVKQGQANVAGRILVYPCQDMPGEQAADRCPTPCAIAPLVTKGDAPCPVAA